MLLDAAMGTRLLTLGLDLSKADPALWNQTHPEFVSVTHRDDVRAGAEALITNTFGASRANLRRLVVDPDVAAINTAAVRLARAAGGAYRPLFASMGPASLESEATFQEQAQSLATERVDALVLETLAFVDVDRPEFDRLVAPARAPVIVSLFDWPDSPATERLAIHLEAQGVAALGFNCEANLVRLTHWAERVRRVTALPLWIKPSAGLPGQDLHAPATFAGLVRRLQPLGRIMIGGCCGTTSAHIRAMHAAIAALDCSVDTPTSDADMVQ